MFHRFVYLSAAVLALLWATASPGQVYAQHGGHGYGRGSYGYGRGFFDPRFGGFDRGFDRRFGGFDRGFDRRFGGFDRGFDRFSFAPGFGGFGPPFFFGGF